MSLTVLNAGAQKALHCRSLFRDHGHCTVTLIPAEEVLGDDQTLGQQGSVAFHPE